MSTTNPQPLRHARSHQRIVVGLLLSAMGIFLACSPAKEEHGPTEIQQRLIPIDPPLFDRRSFFDEKPEFKWSFAEPSEAAAWTPRNIEEATATEDGLSIRAQGDDPQLVRQAPLSASSLHAIEVGLTGLEKGTATLFWAGDGEGFSADRRVEVAAADARGKPPTFRFDVGDHPLWKGTIQRLRLDPTNTPGETVLVRDLAGLRKEPKAEQLATTLTQGYKLDLEPEARSAWLAIPGMAIERTLTPEKNTRLGFGYGLEPNVLQKTDFAIEVFETGSGNTRETLFSKSLDPADQDAGRWFEEEIDLSPYADQEIGIRFTTRTGTPPDLARGFAAWSSPEILEDARGERLPNVVVISLDTLRPDHLSTYGYPRSTSPQIDAWANDSAVQFQNVVTQAPWTLPSHASLFTGLDAVRHGTNHYRGVPASFDLLAEILRDAGYHTAAITGGGYLRPEFGFAQGFETFRYWPEIMAEEELANGLEDAFQWLDENQHRRFFLFFHTYEIHYPHRRRQPWFNDLADAASLAQPKTDFQMREHPAAPGGQWGGNYLVVRRAGSDKHVKGLRPEEWQLAISMYDSAIAYTDAAVGRLLTRLQELGLRGKTLIILTSDHGEALGEKDLTGHNYLEDHNVMIPLLIEFPDQRGAGEAIEQQVRAVDVVPTILELLGLSTRTPLQGESLLPLVEDPEAPFPEDAWTYAASANTGIGLRQANKLKYTYNDTAWSTTLGNERLFDLESDPTEIQDVAAANPQQLEPLRLRARNWLRDQHAGWRLHIQNHEPETVLKGRLTGAWRGRNKVKAIAENCDCIHWEPGRTAEFALEAGQEITLFFADVGGTRSGLEGVLEGPDGEVVERYRQSFQLDSDRGSRSLLYSAAGWAKGKLPAATEEGDTTGFVVFSTGSGETDEAPESPRDPEVEAQLRALGYVQ